MSMALIAAALLAGGAAAPADVAGTWKTQTRNGVVEITHCGQSICGRLVGSDKLNTEPGLKDVNNKDPKLRARPLKGLALLWGFQGSGAKWDGGQIYNPDDGGTYKSTVTLADANTLKVRGCIVWPLCKTQSWTRLR
jgi:uncharacterized protein (DUF2147 family)